MRVTGAVLALTLVMGSGQGRAQGKPAETAQGAREVSVTVTYTGKGRVDDSHELWVYLFDHPEIGAQSEPLAIQPIRKSGGTTTFKSVAADPVYVGVAYDEQGDFDALGEPPVGTPIAIYAKDGKTAPVKPGPDAKVKITFDETVRWK
jgi:hypothetical protein